MGILPWVSICCGSPIIWFEHSLLAFDHGFVCEMMMLQIMRKIVPNVTGVCDLLAWEDDVGGILGVARKSFLGSLRRGNKLLEGWTN